MIHQTVWASESMRNRSCLNYGYNLSKLLLSARAGPNGVPTNFALPGLVGPFFTSNSSHPGGHAFAEGLLWAAAASPPVVNQWAHKLYFLFKEQIAGSPLSFLAALEAGHSFGWFVFANSRSLSYSVFLQIEEES